MNDAVIVEKCHSFEQLPGKLTDEFFGQTGSSRRDELFQSSFRTKFHEDDHLLAVDLHSVVADQMLVMDAFEDAQFVGHPPDGFVIVGLQRYLFHGHQFTRFVVNGHVHLTEAALSLICEKKKKISLKLVICLLLYSNEINYY